MPSAARPHLFVGAVLLLLARLLGGPAHGILGLLREAIVIASAVGGALLLVVAATAWGASLARGVQVQRSRSDR